MAIHGGRPNNRQVVPYLMVRDGRAALDFYQKAFGAKVIYEAPMPGMPGIFAQFKIGESYLQLTDIPGYDAKGPRSPETLGGTSVVMFGGGVKRGFVYGRTAETRPCTTIENRVTLEECGEREQLELRRRLGSDCGEAAGSFRREAV